MNQELSERIRRLTPELLLEALEETTFATPDELHARFNLLAELFSPSSLGKGKYGTAWVAERVSDIMEQKHGPVRTLFECVFTGFLLGWSSCDHLRKREVQ